MAKIREDDIDALRERADIVDIVSAYTRLKKSGPNTFKGLCPFHSEKTPSFSVDAAKSLWKCFGCGEGGNLYQFVQKVESLPFPDAVEWVARKSGFELRYEESRPGEQQRRGVKERLRAANRAAADLFHKTLMEAPEAADARRYLGGRGFGREVAERWKLGYAPGRDSLCKHLLARGFTIDEILQADLGRRSDRDGSLFDAFRRRVIFPTWDLQNDIVGFGARALGDEQPKYLNTAETPLFSKSRVMFGLNRAKSAIGRGVPALIVEGYTDVIALHEAGITEAVATNGVALGETHFEQLKRFSQRAVLMLDSDAAGTGATERAFDIHHRVGLEVLVAILPAGRDPAEVVASEGAEFLRELIEKAEPLLQFKLEQAIAKLPLDTPEARSRAVRDIARVLAWQPDPIARAEYVFMAAQRIGVDEAAIQLALNEERGGVPGERSQRSYEDRRLPGQVKVEREALELLLKQPDQVSVWGQQLVESDFTAAPRRELFRAIQESVEERTGRVEAALAERLSPEGRALFTELALGENGADDPSDTRADEVFVRLRLFRVERAVRRRRDELQEVNPLDDAQRHDALFTELVALEAERRDLRRRLQDNG